MITQEVRADPVALRSRQARGRMTSSFGEPLMLADWDDAVFIHFAIPVGQLAKDVPFVVDTWDGEAIVSLVAFTMRRMRLRLFGRWFDWITAPVSTHEFLNVRTYVRHGDDIGIQFLAEWLPNPLSRMLGPLTYGLPYRLGNIGYQHNLQGAGLISGEVESRHKKVAYHGELPDPCHLSPASAGTLDDFLLERYTAFTFRNGVKRYFRVWHPPWQQTSIRVQIDCMDLLTQVWPWFAKARYIGAHYSPGVKDVWMGRPHRIPRTDGV